MLELKDLVPGGGIPPDMVVREGGNKSVDKETDCNLNLIKQIVTNYNQA